jgi:hypothetical protein
MLNKKILLTAFVIVITAIIILQSCLDPCRDQYQTECTLYKRIIQHTSMWDSLYIDSVKMYTRYHVACDMGEIENFNRSFFNSTTIFAEDSTKYIVFDGDTIDEWTHMCDCCVIY